MSDNDNDVTNWFCMIFHQTVTDHTIAATLAALRETVDPSDPVDAALQRDLDEFIVDVDAEVPDPDRVGWWDLTSVFLHLFNHFVHAKYEYAIDEVLDHLQRRLAGTAIADTVYNDLELVRETAGENRPEVTA